jgi:hypothetical protein
LGEHDGLILFSHSLPDKTGVKEILENLFNERRIKKLYYLELRFGEELQLEDIPNIGHKQLSLYELNSLMEQDRFETRALYEIISIIQLKY